MSINATGMHRASIQDKSERQLTKPAVGPATGGRHHCTAADRYGRAVADWFDGLSPGRT
jgi:hypothetical protein